jgi:putative FmdB family regulatory protein
MPTYEYRCKNCGKHLEVVQSFKDDPLTVCPACGGGPLRKVFGSIGIAFKGSGFYRTDSRSGGKRSTGESSDAKSDSKSESKSESKTSESKSDGKSESKADSSSRSETKSA